MYCSFWEKGKQTWQHCVCLHFLPETVVQFILMEVPSIFLSKIAQNFTFIHLDYRPALPYKASICTVKLAEADLKSAR